MPITTSVLGDRKHTLATFKAMFPNVSPEQVARAAGAPDKSSVQFKGLKNGSLMVSIDHEDVAAERIFHKVTDADGKEHVVLEHAHQQGSESGRGKGYLRFADQLAHLRKIGVDHVRVMCGAGDAHSPEWNGYYTWPRFGFDGKIANFQFRKLSPEVRDRMAGLPQTFHSLFGVEGGADEWKKVGSDTGMLSFDTRPDSDHSKRFAAYYDDRSQREAAGAVRPPVAQTPQPTDAGEGSPDPIPYAAGDNQEATGMGWLSAFVRYQQDKKYGCVYLPIEGDVRDELLALSASIPSDLLAEKGRETEPHVTALYGIENDNPSPTSELVAAFGPVTCTLGAVGVFERPEYDVLKVTVYGVGLHLLNARLRTLPHVSEFPEYKPHVTLAYVQKGTGAALAASITVPTTTLTLDTAVFSDSQRNKTRITMAGPVKYNAKGVEVSNQKQAHPMVNGFAIEHVLRSLANDSTLSADGRQMAKAVLFDGDTSALWPLNDELQDSGHPHANWDRWLTAAHALHLDSAMNHAISAIGRARNEAANRPVPVGIDHYFRFDAINDLRNAINIPPDAKDVPDHLVPSDAAREVVDLMRSQGHSDTDLLKSLSRHKDRQERVRAKDFGLKNTQKQLAMKALLNSGGGKARYALSRYRPNPEISRATTDPTSQVAAGRFVESLIGSHKSGTADVMDWSDKMKGAFPKHFTGDDYHQHAHALAAVAAGKQPVASVPREFIEHHPVGQEFARRFDLAGVDMAGWTQAGADKIMVGGPSAKKSESALGRAAVPVRRSSLEPLSLSGERYATKYKSSPALSDFITAVRQIRSSGQEVRRKIAEDQYKKLKINLVALKDAIADAPSTASANTAHSIEHDGDLDKVRAAAALYGIQTNSPALLIFHSHEDGPHSLFKFDVTGSADKLRSRMDAAGLTHRTLLPTENGWSVLMFDPTGGTGDSLKKFTASEGVPLQHTRGTGEVIGDSPEAEADGDARSDYRSIIRQWEKTVAPTNVQ